MISGDIQLEVFGSAPLTLTGANTYSLRTFINSGAKLALSGAGSVASSLVVLGGNATFNISHITSSTSVQDLENDNSGNVVLLGGKSFTLSAATTTGFSGTFEGSATQASHLTIDLGATAGDYSLANATFTSWTNAGDTIVINGNSRVNDLFGSNQTDVLFGGAGDDILTGGAGVHYLDGGLGGDTLNGTGGVSLADYQDADAGQTINLLNSLLNAGDAAAGDTYVNIHRVLGSSHNDTIAGDNAGDVFSGGAGNDTIVGGAAADRIVGGLGADTLTGGGDANAFQYNFATEGGDTITDFSAAKGDHITISTLASVAICRAAGRSIPISSWSAPTAAIGQFLWNASASTLSWDVDGTGPKAAVEIPYSRA